MKAEICDGIEGTLGEVRSFQAQLELVYAQPDLIMAGSVGRAAMYNTLEWPDAQPLPVTKGGFFAKLAESGWRDMDVISFRRPLPPRVLPSRPYHIDGRTNAFYWTPGDPPSLRLGDLHFPLSPELLHTADRRLADRKVRTLRVGVALEFARRVAPTAASSEKHEAALAEFEKFAHWARGRYPDEFPDDFHFQAFRDYDAMYKSLYNTAL